MQKISFFANYQHSAHNGLADINDIASYKVATLR